MIRTNLQNEMLHTARVYHAQGWPIHEAALLAAEHVRPYGFGDMETLDPDADRIFWN